VTLFDEPTCVCGSPCTLGTVHRLDGPCFVWEPPDTNHLGRFQAHSATSRNAALAVYPRTGTQRARVLNYLRSARDGRTDEEIATGLAMNPSSVRPRRIELVTGGWARAMFTAAGAPVERRTRAGVDAQVWEATNAARSYLP